MTAVLFDIDGTLVDSNYLHVQAWSEALQRTGHPVEDWRIHRCIGMDGSKLLDELLGDVDDAVKRRATKVHTRRYQRLSDRLRAFDRARDLLRTLHDRGVTVVLATSASPEELERLLSVLDADDWVDAVTSKEDVEEAKPEPDILHTALQKAGVAAADAIMVGDATWDGISAARAGVRFVAVRSGGISAAELVDAGAEAVYVDVAHLLADLPTSPLATLTGH
jgi:HAD superfamily hydrolase (TIGR01509 family)